MNVKSGFDSAIHFATLLLQGMVLGLGAVLPGISGGVLCVTFGFYKPIMEFLASPVRSFRKHYRLLIPVFAGVVVGFLGVSKILAVMLETYTDFSVCFFVGLIGGMYPSIIREAGKNGRNGYSYVSFFASLILTFAVIIGIEAASFDILPNTFWYVFCGFCMSLSIIAPGLSFSTLLMPLGLYTPFIDGLGSLRPDVLVPGLFGAAVTLILLSKLINRLFETHYSVAFHAIAGIVLAATAIIVPYGSIFESAPSFFADAAALTAGALIAFLFGPKDKADT